MATYSSILVCRILWTEEPGRLQSTGLQRVGHDWATNIHTHTHIHILMYIYIYTVNIIPAYYLYKLDSHVKDNISPAGSANYLFIKGLLFNSYSRISFWLFMFTATAKSLQSCPTLCNPIDGSPPGSSVPGILQARTLEWVAISFSKAWKWKVKVKSLRVSNK